MSKKCPMTGTVKLYTDCLECEMKAECFNGLLDKKEDKKEETVSEAGDISASAETVSGTGAGWNEENPVSHEGAISSDEDTEDDGDNILDRLPNMDTSEEGVMHDTDTGIKGIPITEKNVEKMRKFYALIGIVGIVLFIVSLLLLRLVPFLGSSLLAISVVLIWFEAVRGFKKDKEDAEDTVKMMQKSIKEYKRRNNLFKRFFGN